VLVYQNDINFRTEAELPKVCFPSASNSGSGGYPVENLACDDDAEDSGGKAVNYRTEPLWKRLQHPPGMPFSSDSTTVTATNDLTTWWDVLSNGKVGGTDPVTPVYSVRQGTQVRLRLLMPGGHSRNIVPALHGHIWDREPWIQDSTRIGRNSFSFWEGAHFGHGPTNHYDVLLRDGAGGKSGSPATTCSATRSAWVSMPGCGGSCG
jgi:hypothetical protein